MLNERKGISGESAYKLPFDISHFPHGDDFKPKGNTSEDVKLVNEPGKYCTTRRYWLEQLLCGCRLWAAILML